MSEFFDKYPIGSYVSMNYCDHIYKAKVVGHLIYGSYKKEYLFLVFNKKNICSWFFSEWYFNMYLTSSEYDFECCADIESYVGKNVYNAQEIEIIKG